jgi:hypothetical protein
MLKTLTVTAIAALSLATAALADDDDGKGPAKKSKMKFWNLTGTDLTEVSLAPAGTDKFGDNQASNDDDKIAENDERLPLKDVAAGQYDVRIKDKSGRTCIVKGVEVKDSGPYSFSIEADQLQDCKS